MIFVRKMAFLIATLKKIPVDSHLRLQAITIGLEEPEKQQLL
jgi:hypothetical protein